MKDFREVGGCLNEKDQPAHTVMCIRNSMEYGVSKMQMTICTMYEHHFFAMCLNYLNFNNTIRLLRFGNTIVKNHHRDRRTRKDGREY